MVQRPNYQYKRLVAITLFSFEIGIELRDCLVSFGTVLWRFAVFVHVLLF